MSESLNPADNYRTNMDIQLLGLQLPPVALIAEWYVPSQSTWRQLLLLEDSTKTLTAATPSSRGRRKEKISRKVLSGPEHIHMRTVHYASQNMQ